MSAKVKLSGKLPGDEDINGLDATVSNLIEHPEKLRLGLVWYDVSQIADITDTGARVPTVRVRRFEPAGTADDAPQELRDMALRLFEERTKKTPLPIGQTEYEQDGPVD